MNRRAPATRCARIRRFPATSHIQKRAARFSISNTSKKSLTLDPTTPTGAEVFRALIGRADLLIENHPPGYLDRIGLGFDTLNALNPRLILTSITPFGQIGPYRDWKGTDLIEFAMSLTGYNTPTMVVTPSARTRCAHRAIRLR